MTTAAVAPAGPPLSEEPRILDRFAEDLAHAGVVGEERAGKLLYLAVTSRLLDRPVCVLVKAPSSAGKSFTVEKVLTFFPPGAYLSRTAMSERVLAYTDESLKNRVLVLYEAGGISGEMGTYLVRSLVSEGRINYEVVERVRGQFRTRHINKEGPTGLIMTTTAVHLHPENETRMLSVSVNDTPAQTREILLATAEEFERLSGPCKMRRVELTEWHQLQLWLVGADHRVAVPYASALAKLVPPSALRLRRDLRVVLTLVQASALLHQTTRSRDSEGRIFASLDDYATVRSLVADLIADGIESSVPASVRETVEAVRDLLRDTPGRLVEGYRPLAERLRLDKSAVARRVQQAIERGYLVNHQERAGRPVWLALGEPLPEDKDLLPTVEVLAEAVRCCSVAGVSGGKGEEKANPTPTQPNVEVIEV
ncbi:MAG TPA: hypothetical protein VK714_00455 [Myxococcota bacterium]|nr:hypothetical protein [Myxococcota bacterium]